MVVLMDLRTKLVFALVAVALGSMLTLGGLSYSHATSLLRDRSLAQIEGIAEAKLEGIENIVDGWEERVQLIASRTQLRLSLAEHNRTGSAATSQRIQTILEDAVESAPSVERLAVYGLDGVLVSAVDRAVATTAPTDGSGRMDDLPPSESGPMYTGLRFPLGIGPRVGFETTLLLDDVPIGGLRAELDVVEIADMAANLRGMGETGETLVAVRDGDGRPRLLHPVRQRSSESTAPPPLAALDGPLTLALGGNERSFAGGVTDYRGETVWAATRLMPRTGWGVVVKFDADEQQEPINAYRQEVIRLSLSLAAFAILAGTLLGLRFAGPIHDLAEVANRVREGELDARAAVQAEDEVGLLTRTFNDMTEELERRMALLYDYQKFFEVSVDMLCIAGMDGYFKRTNPAFERTLGWTKEELLSKPFFDFIHPEDVEDTQREVEKLAQGIPTISFENRYLCADGTYKHLLWAAHPEPETGTLFSVARDITELKRLRQRGEAGR